MVNGERYFLAQIIDNEVISIAIFGLERVINGIPYYSLGFAVKETYRGKGLAIKIMNIGLGVLKGEISKRFKVKGFYLEGLIDQGNINSLRVASKLTSKKGIPTQDYETGTPSYLFEQYIEI